MSQRCALAGLEAIRHPASDASGRHVLVVTTFDQDEHVFRALRHGAAGFLLKDTPPEQLLEAIRVVARGAALLAPTITRRLIAAFARTPRRARGHARMVCGAHRPRA